MIWLYLHFPALCPESDLSGSAAENPGHRTLKRLALRAQRQVAHVALNPPCGLLLETGSMWRLDTPEHLQQTITGDMEDLGFAIQASQGTSPLAARLLAEAGGQPAELTEDGQKAALHSLPLQACDLEPKTVSALLRVGIRHCSELLALPAASLGQRFGPTILHWRERLLGHIPDPQEWFTPPERFDQHLDLNEDIEHVQGIRFPLGRLLTALEDYCRQTQQATDELALRLHHRERSPTDLRLGSATPEARAAVWEELARLHLERVTLYAPVTALSLRSRRLQPYTARDEELMRDPADSTDEPRQLISRLQARLGRQALLRRAWQEDYRPQNYTRWIAGHEPGHGRPPNTQTQMARQHPIWLLPEPRPVRLQRLQLITGPERIQTGWWDLRGIKRDYYQARLADHSLVWVYERPDGQWFIAGYFG
ncbi:MAG: DNA polymerase Y family protein [Natronospirillum sp.]|uniref:Y-family DNA polymerase n=1 Tax=Natronospirillum sp. TaxID=2812955 RepID=UPI0025DCE779|nr:DNA polymerase Y family protein [Natronospirillum sp.]MCH8552152.1 DNA polymerase Y family protein [Natronospirillum sp.]